jgi:hypothetical protein
MIDWTEKKQICYMGFDIYPENGEEVWVKTIDGESYAGKYQISDTVSEALYYFEFDDGKGKPEQIASWRSKKEGK